VRTVNTGTWCIGFEWIDCFHVRRDGGDVGTPPPGGARLRARGLRQPVLPGAHAGAVGGEREQESDYVESC